MNLSEAEGSNLYRAWVCCLFNWLRDACKISQERLPHKGSSDRRAITFDAVRR
ncbi:MULTISPECIES: hypothetical protein [unclassified Coleofasciculus]|uniref:hypothetical protein n=1 Tax=unclassified Coleofasciculus TaxID=2692782 RepID=UPI0018818537|nr:MULTISPECIES: hypothetical protein [unclassified Coleofasciculus]MBE9125495.1 hypothetical protein [Coleofasciculus sp. LEGE 07081]MBE9148641.1 hypothetical protein [Coleofasciculus sp. LEGE 07092]